MNGISRGAGYLTYNGSFFTYQCIQQRRFTNIRLTNDSKLWNAFFRIHFCIILHQGHHII